MGQTEPEVVTVVISSPIVVGVIISPPSPSSLLSLPSTPEHGRAETVSAVAMAVGVGWRRKGGWMLNYQWLTMCFSVYEVLFLPPRKTWLPALVT